MDLISCTPQQWIENETEFSKRLEDQTYLSKIPLLNVNELEQLKDSMLVRFRGMIQDMHSPEYYLEKFEVIYQNPEEKAYKSAKYSDFIPGDIDSVNFESKANVTSERQTYVVVSIPGLNEWVNSVEKQQYQLLNDTEIRSNQTKRSFDETMDSEGLVSSTEGNKRFCVSEVQPTPTVQRVLAKESILNFPLPDSKGKICQIKVYDNCDKLKLNDVCEFIGFLSLNPFVESAYQDLDEIDNRMELKTLNLASSLVPKIHCVSFKKIRHSNPLLPEIIERIPVENFKFIHKELLILLTQLLLGDELAAEYLICHLISEIYLRKDCLALGKFSMNISNIPKVKYIDYTCELYKFIEKLIPKSYYLSMTLQNMNDLSFTPKKDYECNRLISGILQLSANTHIILDETKLTPGKLNSAGVNNIHAVTNTIKYQKVVYDFNYYPLEFNCDIPFLILSEGKSLINSDTHIMLQPEEISLATFGEIMEAATHFLKPNLLDDIRRYLTTARLIEYNIENNMEDLIQNEFVDMRQKSSATADDLHSLLVLARLVCLSYGKSSLDEESWRKACKLEEARKARIS